MKICSKMANVEDGMPDQKVEQCQVSCAQNEEHNFLHSMVPMSGSESAPVASYLRNTVAIKRTHLDNRHYVTLFAEPTMSNDTSVVLDM